MHSEFINLDKFLARHDHFIISTHESPDGDGLGAEIAFNELLHKLGKESYILNSDPLPDKYHFMDIDNEIHVFRNARTIPFGAGPAAVVVLDTNDFQNIGSAYQHLRDIVSEIFIIDHHEGGNDKFESNFIKAEASSASEIVYGLYGYYRQVPSFKAAQAMYTGILFDTGSFRYPKTTPETFRIIANLVELGANPFTIYEHIYENNSLNSFRLKSMVLSTMEVHHDGGLIIMRLTPQMIEETGASFSEGELMINIPLTIEGVIASVLIKQDINGPVKVSMRTKGDYDVAEIAIVNGGGGHKNAAGYKSKLGIEDTHRKALADMEKFFIKS